MNVKKLFQFSIGPFGAAAIGIVILPFVAWFFSVEDVGRLTMLQIVLSLSISLFSLEMHQAYVREYHEEADKFSLLKVAALPGLILTTFLSFILLVSPISISRILFGIESEFLTVLLLVAVFSVLLNNFLAHVVRMQERGLVFSATQIAPKAFLLIFIILIFVLNLEAEFKWLMLMNTLAVFITFMIFALLTRDTWKPALLTKINVCLLKRMLSFSLPLVAGGLAFWGLTTMDRFFLRSLIGFEELGVYAMSVALASSVSVISAIFSNLWHPIVYKWVKEGVDSNKVQSVIESMLIVVAMLWSLIGLFSWVLLYFLPPEYKAIEYLIVACAAMPLLYMLSETTVVGIGLTRKTSFAMVASIVAFIVNGMFNYLLIPNFGAGGAALATLFSFFVFFTIRTEASAWLWHSIPRIKIYVILIFYTLITSIMVLSKAEIVLFNIAWLVLGTLTLTLYKKRLFSSLIYLKTNFYKRS